MNFDMTEPLTDANFLLFAARNYDNPSCFDTVEFYEDLKRFSYVKKLITRYEETGDLKERLILNHIIVIYNVFGADAATKMLFVRLEGHLSTLKPFLELLGFLPKTIHGVGVKNLSIDSNEIVSNTYIQEVLRSI